MKIKTSDLTGAALDWAVAKCEGDMVPDGGVMIQTWPFYSSDWAQGGPIIERKRIGVTYEPSLLYDDSCRWKALCAISDNGHEYGPTPLVASMRCYVASISGEEIEVPEILLSSIKPEGENA